MEKFEKNNNLKSPEKESDYFLPDVFKELEPLTFSLVAKLKENIDKGEYDVLIGDDASGRIPTLILRGVFNARSRKLHPELKDSDSEVVTRFIAGGQVENRKEMEEALKKIKSENNKKALVVTEYISSGKSMERMSEILNNLGMTFDVAAFISNKEKIKIPEISRFLYGDLSLDNTYEDIPPAFYDKPELNGVVKDAHAQSYAIPFIKDLSAEQDEIKDIQEKINLARKDVDLLVKKTLKEIWGE